MAALMVHGGSPLHGAVQVQGSKNVALHLLAAAILNADVTTIDNVPRLPDLDVIIELLSETGPVVRRDGHRFDIDARDIAPEPRMPPAAGAIRPTLCYAAALLARTDACDACIPGGDRFCVRGTDVHVRVFDAAGATIEQTGGRLRLRAPRGGLRAFTVSAMTPYGPSLGGTVTALLVAATIPETSVVWSPSLEPEVAESAALLRLLGVRIDLTKQVMRITGRESRAAPVQVENPADRMVAGTLVLYAAMTGGTLELPQQAADLLPPGFLQVTRDLGIERQHVGARVRFRAPGPLHPVDARTAVHPGFPTDLQPQLCATAAVATGSSRVVETVYPRRATHVLPLQQLGIAISAQDGPPATITVHGPGSRLRSATVAATDIRAAAALVGAALATPGKSVIAGAEHLMRGYENLPATITRLGGAITWTHDVADTTHRPA